MNIDDVICNDEYLDEVAKEFVRDDIENYFEQIRLIMSSECDINNLIEEIRNLWRTMQSFVNSQLGDMMFETAKFIRTQDKTHTFISKKYPGNTISVKTQFVKPLRLYRHQHR